MYVLATLSLLRLVQNTHMSQKWYADDGSAVGLLFFKQLTEHGSYFGYIVNTLEKSINSRRGFKDQCAHVWGDGCYVLGSVIGNEKTYETFKVTNAGMYANLLKQLGQVEKAFPQIAYACLTRGVQQLLNFVSRITTTSRSFFRDTDANMKTHVLPSFCDSPASQFTRRFYSMQTRVGGLNIKEQIGCETEYAASLTPCAPLEDEVRSNSHLTQEGITL